MKISQKLNDYVSLNNFALIITKTKITLKTPSNKLALVWKIKNDELILDKNKSLFPEMVVWHHNFEQTVQNVVKTLTF